MATLGYEYKPDISTMSYDDMCIALTGMDTDELKQRNEEIHTNN